MNRIVNKALLYKEWINVRWITLLTTLVLLYFKVFGIIYEQNLNKEVMKTVGKLWTNRWFNNGLYIKDKYFYSMVFVIILLAITLFIGEKSSSSQGFIASMPFTKKEIILNKWIVGVFSILISFAVTYIILSLVYLANINGIDTSLNPYSDLFKWFFMDTIEYICIFTFMMLMQAVMGNSIVSGIAGGIIPFVPFIVISIVQEVLNSIYKNTINFSYIFASWFNIYSYNIVDQKWYNTEPNSGKDMYRTFYYSDYGIKLLILFLITCLFLYLTYSCYIRREMECNLKLITFNFLEPVFICSTVVLIGLIAGEDLKFGNNSMIAFFILAVVFGTAGYFISKLLLKVLSSAR